MDHALGMSGVESVGNLNGERQGFVEGKRAAGEGVLEGAAVEKLHDDERMRIGFANFVDGAYVGVMEGGGGLGLALKAFESLRVAGDAVGKKFQRDEAVQLAVFCLVNDAHAATAEFFYDAEMPKRCGRSGWENPACGHDSSYAAGTVNERRFLKRLVTKMELPLSREWTKLSAWAMRSGIWRSGVRGLKKRMRRLLWFKSISKWLAWWRVRTKKDLSRNILAKAEDFGWRGWTMNCPVAWD